MAKHIALAEETTFRSAGSNLMYFKLLSEDVNTTREDFYPETTQGWVPQHMAEGLFRTAGSFTTPVEPIMFPKILALGLGDPISGSVADSSYSHVVRFGGVETVHTSGIKPFTTTIGVGIEKDREIKGCVIESISIEAVAREVVTAKIGIIGSGAESLITACVPTYTAYAENYFTFASVSTMTIGETDRLTTAPTIEAFRLNLKRGWDADHYVLGNRHWAEPSLSGMASVEGSMDLSFSSEDEHERFLSIVGGSAVGLTSSFAISITFKGGLAGSTTNYSMKIDIPKAYYKASTASVKGRDRIIQTVDYTAIYDSTSSSAIYFTLVNKTSSYVNLI